MRVLRCCECVCCMRVLGLPRFAMGSAVLFILRSKLLLYSAGSAVNRMLVVLSGFSVRLIYFVQANTVCRTVWLYVFPSYHIVYPTQ